MSRSSYLQKISEDKEQAEMPHTVLNAKGNTTTQGRAESGECNRSGINVCSWIFAHNRGNSFRVGDFIWPLHTGLLKLLLVSLEDHRIHLQGVYIALEGGYSGIDSNIWKEVSACSRYVMEEQVDMVYQRCIFLPQFKLKIPSDIPVM
jgi:hypothetical protein